MMEIAWNDDDFVHIYRTEIPGISDIPMEPGDKTFAFVAWTAVVSVVACVAFIVCLCCLWWKLYPKYSSRRQSSSAGLVASRMSTAVTFQARSNSSVDVGLINSVNGTGNIYSRGVVNFAFTGVPEHATTNLQLEDGPPAYTTVISQNPTDTKAKKVQFPCVSETKTVETPPPAYMTVAPFK